MVDQRLSMPINDLVFQLLSTAPKFDIVRPCLDGILPLWPAVPRGTAVPSDDTAGEVDLDGRHNERRVVGTNLAQIAWRPTEYLRPEQMPERKSDGQVRVARRYCKAFDR